MKDYEDNLFSSRVTPQQLFEESMESLEDVIHQKCSKCGKLTVDECTVDYCEEPSCEFEQLGDLFYNPGYQEIMFDSEDGHQVKNFLGKEK